MHPLASGVPRLFHRDLDDALPDALMSGTLGDHRVLYPGMHESVPRHVDEPDDTALVPCHHPPQAVSMYLLQPIPFGLVVDASLEGLAVQRVHLAVGEAASPLVRDAHDLLPQMPHTARCRFVMEGTSGLEADELGVRRRNASWDPVLTTAHS